MTNKVNEKISSDRKAQADADFNAGMTLTLAAIAIFGMVFLVIKGFGG